MNGNTDIEAIRQLIEARATAIASAEAEAAIEPLARDVVVYDLQPPLAFAGADARDAEELRAWLKTWKELGPGSNSASRGFSSITTLALHMVSVACEGKRSEKARSNCGFALLSYSSVPKTVG